MVSKGARAKGNGRSNGSRAQTQGKAPAEPSDPGAVWPCAFPAGEKTFTQSDVNHPYRRRFK